MKIVDRLLMFLLSLAVMAFGVGLIVAGLQRQAVLSVFTRILNGPASYGWAMLLCGVVLIFVGLVIIVGSALRPEKDRQRTQAVVTTAEGSNVQMSVNAIESVIKRAALSVPGVGEPKTDIRNSENGIIVNIKTPVIEDVNIPETISNLHNTVRHYLENLAGLKVADIQVLVTEVSQAKVG